MGFWTAGEEPAGTCRVAVGETYWDLYCFEPVLLSLVVVSLLLMDLFLFDKDGSDTFVTLRFLKSVRGGLGDAVEPFLSVMLIGFYCY